MMSQITGTNVYTSSPIIHDEMCTLTNGRELFQALVHTPSRCQCKLNTINAQAKSTHPIFILATTYMYHSQVKLRATCTVYMSWDCNLFKTGDFNISYNNIIIQDIEVMLTLNCLSRLSPPGRLTWISTYTYVCVYVHVKGEQEKWVQRESREHDKQGALLDKRHNACLHS